MSRLIRDTLEPIRQRTASLPPMVPVDPKPGAGASHPIVREIVPRPVLDQACGAPRLRGSAARPDP